MHNLSDNPEYFHITAAAAAAVAVLCTVASDAFEKLLSLGVLEPGWRPAGLDAGSVLEALVVSSNVGEARLTHRAGRKKKKKNK